MLNFSSIEEMEQYNVQALAYRIAIPTMLAISSLGMVGNLVIFVAILRVKICSPHIQLTGSLALCDGLSSLAYGATVFLNSYMARYHKEWLQSDRTYCYMYILEAFRLGLFFSSAIHLLAIAATHLVATERPIYYRKVTVVPERSGKRMWVIVTLWTVPIGFVSLVFVANWSETFGQTEKLCHGEFLNRGWFRWMLFGGISTIAIIMVVIYGRVSYKLKDQGARAGRTAYMRHRSRRARSALLIFGTFMIGWIPAVLWYSLTCNECSLPIEQLHVGVRFTGSIMVNLLLNLKFLLNPVIYALRIPEIRYGLICRTNNTSDCIGSQMPSETAARKYTVARDCPRARRSASQSTSQSMPMSKTNRSRSNPSPILEEENMKMEIQCDNNFLKPIFAHVSQHLHSGTAHMM